MPLSFKETDIVVHPKHGLGCIGSVEEHEVGGRSGRFLTVAFTRSMLTMRIPEAKLATSGLREVCSKATMRAALALLAKPAVKVPGHWSKRRVLLEEKLNSGEPQQLGELLRDLNGGTSASGGRLYKEALLRLAEELAIVDGIEAERAEKMISGLLAAKVDEPDVSEADDEGADADADAPKNGADLAHV